MNKVQKKRTATGAAFALLANKLLATSLSETAYRNAVGEFFVRETDEQYGLRFTQLLRDDRFRKQFTAYSKSFSDIVDNEPLRRYSSMQRIWRTCQYLLVSRAKDISRFVQLRESFEASTLIANWPEAEAAVKSCEEEFGDSIWLLRAKLLMYHLRGDAASVRTACAECRDRCIESLTRTIIDYLERSFESNDAFTFYRSTVVGMIDEFRSSGRNSTACTLDRFFSPALLASENRSEASILHFSIFLLPDLYELLLDMVRSAAVETKLNGHAMQADLQRMFQALLSHIDDPVLLTIQRLLEGQLEYTPLPEKDAPFFEDYERGQYIDCVNNFSRSQHSLPNVLGYINVAAKAQAIAQPDGFRATTLTELLATHLAKYYSCPPSLPEAEHNLVSWLVRLRGFHMYVHLQAGLYMAQTNRHEQTALARAACLSLSTSPCSSPLAYNIVGKDADRFGARYGMRPVGDMAIHRRLKRQFVDAVSSGCPQNEIDSLLEEYRAANPIAKDYFELISEYAIHQGKFHQLNTRMRFRALPQRPIHMVLSDACSHSGN